jgi:hypothetical protein
MKFQAMSVRWSMKWFGDHRVGRLTSSVTPMNFEVAFQRNLLERDANCNEIRRA